MSWGRKDVRGEARMVCSVEEEGAGGTDGTKEG